MSDFIIENGILKKFYGFDRNVVIPEGVTAIGDCAFEGCSLLTSITIPDSVTVIGEKAFHGCRGLADAQGFVIVRNVLYDYYGQGGHVCIPDGVTAIGEEAFQWRNGLTSITIPDSVTSVGDRAFQGCKGLTDAQGLVIVQNILYDCDGRCSHICIPDGVTSIGDYAFKGCDLLASVTIPDSVTAIGKEAFSGCSNLTSITIPDGVTFIGERAFYDCDRLTIHWSGRGTVGGNAFKGVVCAVLPRMVCSELKGAESVRAAVRGFLRKANVYTDSAIRAKYEKYIAGQRKKLLPEFFAENCVFALTICAEQNKITAENFDAEYMTPAMKANAAECVAFLLDWKSRHLSQETVEQQLEKELLKDLFNVTDMKKLWSYQELADGTLMLTSYKGDEQAVCVPAYIGQKTVTALGKFMFSPYMANACGNARRQICTIDLPDSITSIGRGAFSGCSSLTSINIPDSITSIGGSAFNGCSSLTDITLPDGIASIGEWVFKGCSSLTRVILPDSVTFISWDTFSGGSNLTIHASAGSYAETYAKEHNISFAVK